MDPDLGQQMFKIHIEIFNKEQHNSPFLVISEIFPPGKTHSTPVLVQLELHLFLYKVRWIAPPSPVTQLKERLFFNYLWHSAVDKKKKKV